jgi:hypothetical protein
MQYKQPQQINSDPQGLYLAAVSPRRYKRNTPDLTKSIAPHPHGRRRLEWEMVVVRPCKKVTSPAVALDSALGCHFMCREV